MSLPSHKDPLKALCPLSLLFFEVLMDIVPETNDAVRGTYLQFTRNVALAQLQRPIGYRFADSQALWQRSVTIRVICHRIGGDSYLQQAHPTARDGYTACRMHVACTNFHTEWNM